MDKNKNKHLIAFQQVTFTKVLALFFSLIFGATVACSIAFKFTYPDIIILEELRIVATLTGTYLGGYLGKSGYEYYSRTRYSTMELERYGPQTNSSSSIPPSNNGGLQI